MFVLTLQQLQELLVQDFSLNSQDLILGLEMCKEERCMERRGVEAAQRRLPLLPAKLSSPQVGTVHGQLWTLALARLSVTALALDEGPLALD